MAIFQSGRSIVVLLPTTFQRGKVNKQNGVVGPFEIWMHLGHIFDLERESDRDDGPSAFSDGHGNLSGVAD